MALDPICIPIHVIERFTSSYRSSRDGDEDQIHFLVSTGFVADPLALKGYLFNSTVCRNEKGLFTRLL